MFSKIAVSVVKLVKKQLDLIYLTSAKYTVLSSISLKQLERTVRNYIRRIKYAAKQQEALSLTFSHLHIRETL